MADYENFERHNFPILATIKDHTSMVTSLKKDTYLVLKQFHDFETAQARAMLLSRRRHDGGLYVSLLLVNLDIFFKKLAEDTEDLPQMYQFVRAFSIFRGQVAENLDSKRVLERVLVSRLLRRHSLAFNAIIQNHIQPEIDFEVWTEIKLLTVAIWGNQVNFSL